MLWAGRGCATGQAGSLMAVAQAAAAAAAARCMAVTPALSLVVGTLMGSGGGPVQQLRHSSSTTTTTTTTSTTTTTITSSSSGSAPDGSGATGGGPAGGSEGSNALLEHIKTKIMMRGGPMSLAEYMQDALTSPQGGFYMRRDVFGRAGDFITSPEISQVFGELVGVWCVHTWLQLGQVPHVAIVELGPGRGTLMADLLRATAGFKQFASAVEVHLVEVSPALRALQWAALRCTPDPQAEADRRAAEWGKEPLLSTATQDGSGGEGGGSAGSGSGSGEEPPLRGISGWSGCKVTWHSSVVTVPESCPALFVAHEFVDALPVHQFVRDAQRGWLEVMVDVAEGSTAAHHGLGKAAAQAQPGQPGAGGGEATFEGVGGGAAGGGSGGIGDGAPAPAVAADDATPPSALGEGSRPASSGAGGGEGPGGPGAPPAVPAAASTSPAPEGEVTTSDLRMVLSPNQTPASALLVPRRLAALPEDKRDGVDAIEVCGHGMALAERLAQRIGRSGGAALFVDYGQDGPYRNSLMAIRAHKGVGVLDGPGTADLSAWVDFSALRQAVEGSGSSVRALGPVTQAAFLRGLGIDARLESLVRGATLEQAQELQEGCRRLLDEGPSGMGRSYMAMALVPEALQGPVAGFDAA